MSALIEPSGVTRTFVLPSGERLEVLKGIDLIVEPGSVTAIVGRSGSGKSTLLNLLGLLDTPTSGTYLLDGRDVSRLGDRARSQMRGQTLGFVFQQFHLLERRTALENVAEPLLFGSRTERTGRTRRAADLSDQAGLAERAQSMPHLLSGGEQQRVAIARAIARQPRIVLADEPTGALDVATGSRILDLLIARVQAEKVALILVTHDPMVASKASRKLTLDAGQFTIDHRPDT